MGISVSDWHSLKPHLMRDALIVVSPELDLVEVSERVVADDAATLAEWIEKGLISKPSLPQIETWNREPSRNFSFVIAQPYVLMQELAQ